MKWTLSTIGKFENEPSGIITSSSFDFSTNTIEVTYYNSEKYSVDKYPPSKGKMEESICGIQKETSFRYYRWNEKDSYMMLKLQTYLCFVRSMDVKLIELEFKSRYEYEKMNLSNSDFEDEDWRFSYIFFSMIGEDCESFVPIQGLYDCFLQYLSIVPEDIKLPEADGYMNMKWELENDISDPYIDSGRVYGDNFPIGRDDDSLNDDLDLDQQSPEFWDEL